MLIKYIKIVLWRVAKRLSYIEDARCLKVNGTFGQINRRTFRNSMISQPTVLLFGFMLVLPTDGLFHCYVSYACLAPRQLLYKRASYLEFGNPCSILSNKHFFVDVLLAAAQIIEVAI